MAIMVGSGMPCWCSACYFNWKECK